MRLTLAPADASDRLRPALSRMARAAPLSTRRRTLVSLTASMRQTVCRGAAQRQMVAVSCCNYFVSVAVDTPYARTHTPGMKIDRRLARKAYRIRFQGTDEDLRPDFDQWLDGNASFFAEVITLHPGGRATISRGPQILGPEGPVRVPIELWWRPSSKDGLPYITAFRVEAPPGMVLTPYEHPYGWDTLHLGDYWAGLVLRLGTAEPKPAGDATPPASGKTPSLDFYRGLIAAYDELVRDRHPAPISVLVERYQARPGTVKSWLHRGRKYLKEES